MYDEKPISMSVKDFLVRKLAIKLLTEEKTIEAVVNHQFISALSATKTNKEIELSGFGKLYFNNKKAQKAYEKNLSKQRVFENILSQPDITEARRRSYENKLQSTIAFLNDLKPKINNDADFPNLRGMEEQFAALQEPEGDN